MKQQVLLFSCVGFSNLVILAKILDFFELYGHLLVEGHHFPVTNIRCMLKFQGHFLTKKSIIRSCIETLACEDLSAQTGNVSHLGLFMECLGVLKPNPVFTSLV